MFGGLPFVTPPVDHPAADAAVKNHEDNAMGQFHLHLCAFHIAKKNPSFQVEAHHYCAPVNDELHQCVVFDSNGKNARVLGIEYIISDALYDKLPDTEKKYWHPHTYEILSGELVAPALSPEEELKLMGGILRTWGKTWHTWPDPKTAVPLGEPLLMWSTSKDGQLAAEFLAKRDKDFGISTPQIRRRRSGLGRVPQIDPPKSIDELGRQWTSDGPDEPGR
jgi:hypothetical protein